MNRRTMFIAAAVAAFALTGLERSSLAEDAMDDLVATSDHDSPDRLVDSEQLESQLESMAGQIDSLVRSAEQAPNDLARREIERAQRQLEQQMQQLQRQREAMEHARTAIGTRRPRSARDQIRDATAKLRTADDEATRETVIDDLESVLNQLFDEDMERRAAELRRIEERLVKLRQQLDRRREKQQEIIDLQMKVILNEADGLGFLGTTHGNHDPFGGGAGMDSLFGHPFGDHDAPFQEPMGVPHPPKPPTHADAPDEPTASSRSEDSF